MSVRETDRERERKGEKQIEGDREKRREREIERKGERQIESYRWSSVSILFKNTN